jgi:hypothetical protein
MDKTRIAAIEILLHNSHGPYQGLPRTAGWGYPEPYTRDWMIASLGILASGNAELIATLQHTLAALALHQTGLGHIPSLAHDPDERGASDTTPLFLIALALYRRTTGEHNFLEDAAQKALRWLQYQSPDDAVLIAQQPTSDWRDEQWVLGYGLYTNTLLYACLRLYKQYERAMELQHLMNQVGVRHREGEHIVHEGLRLAELPYYALWVYKVHTSERFDLLGNSLAILFGVASTHTAREIITWVEKACEGLRASGELDPNLTLPPCLMPYIHPGAEDWLPRYERFNWPGEYHNGGVWPYIVSFYIAALVVAGEYQLAELKFAALSELVERARSTELSFGFNEWYRAQNGQPAGEDWQTWSAAMYLYTAACVENKSVPFFSAWGEAIE